MERIKFTVGAYALMVAGLDDDATENNPLNACTFVRRYGKHGEQYEGTREQVKAVLDDIEGCPAYSPPGEGGGGEGFGGEYNDVAAVRRASDSIRKALGLPLLGWRRTVRRRRRRSK